MSENRIPELVQALQQVIELKIHPLIDELDNIAIGHSAESSHQLNWEIAAFTRTLNSLADCQGMKRDENGQWYKP